MFVFIKDCMNVCMYVCVYVCIVLKLYTKVFLYIMYVNIRRLVRTLLNLGMHVCMYACANRRISALRINRASFIFAYYSFIHTYM